MRRIITGEYRTGALMPLLTPATPTKPASVVTKAPPVLFLPKAAIASVAPKPVAAVLPAPPKPVVAVIPPPAPKPVALVPSPSSAKPLGMIALPASIAASIVPKPAPAPVGLPGLPPKPAAPPALPKPAPVIPGVATLPKKPPPAPLTRALNLPSAPIKAGPPVVGPALIPPRPVAPILPSVQNASIPSGGAGNPAGLPMPGGGGYVPPSDLPDASAPPDDPYAGGMLSYDDIYGSSGPSAAETSAPTFGMPPLPAETVAHRARLDTIQAFVQYYVG